MYTLWSNQKEFVLIFNAKVADAFQFNFDINSIQETSSLMQNRVSSHCNEIGHQETGHFSRELSTEVAK
jgi:hypothetical protein